MKKAQDQALTNRNYSAKLFEITRNLIPNDLLTNMAAEKELYVIITPDKGLCGSLVTNLAKNILEIIAKQKNAAYFISIGKKGEQTLTKYSKNVLATFDFGISQPRYSQVVPVAKLILDEFEKRSFARVFILYTDYVNTLIQKPTLKQILPIKKESLGQNIAAEEQIDYIFEPNKKLILKHLIPYYIENQLFQLVLESYASEQSARMMAMKNATDNANEITKELTLIYNRERQMQITNEINDIATAQLAI
jgi:F-type H+-transporting ATPase subunit gamma